MPAWGTSSEGRQGPGTWRCFASRRAGRSVSVWVVSKVEMTELVVARARSRPRVVGAAVFGSALTVPFAASAAWAAPICACGGAPAAAPEPPTPDVRGTSPDAAQRWIDSAAEAAPAPPAHSPAPAPSPAPVRPDPPVEAAEPPPAPEPRPEPEPEPPTPDVRALSPDAAERRLESDAEPEPAPVQPAPPPEPPPATTTTAPLGVALSGSDEGALQRAPSARPRPGRAARAGGRTGRTGAASP